MTIVWLSVLLVALGAVWFWFRSRPQAANPEFEDLNEKFLRNPGNKEGTVGLVRVYQDDDLVLLRSLLEAEGIETYVPESRMGGLYPLSTIPGFADSVVTVYQADVEAGRRVVVDFLADTSPGENRPELLIPD